MLTKNISIAEQRTLVDNAIKMYWGDINLHPLQEETIEAVLAGKDTILIAHTGMGKSLTYQAPAAVPCGLSVVVSPLIALMIDQVNSLKGRGISAACIHSDMTDDEINRTTQNVISGDYQLLYVAPERIVTPEMIYVLSQCNLDRFVIDEFHLVSHWGCEFREDYYRLDCLRKAFPNISIHCCSASANVFAVRDAIDRLGLKIPTVIKGSYHRDNIEHVMVTPDDEHVVRTLENCDAKNEPTIIYTITRKDAETTSEYLNNLGYNSVYFHSKVKSDRKLQLVEDFVSGKENLMIATSAFGMGVNRPDVRNVIFLGMPDSMENYHNMAGRAGRDGKPARVVLRNSPILNFNQWASIMDVPNVLNIDEDFILSLRDEDPVKEILYRKLICMYAFTQSQNCLAQDLCYHFGETIEPCSHSESSIKCSNCMKGN